MVLVKASRSVGLQRLALALIDRLGAAGSSDPSAIAGRVVKTILIAAVVSLVVSILLTPYLIKLFSRQGFGQEIREDGPQTHQAKRGTPTMGGVAIIIAMWAGYLVAVGVQAMTGGGGPTASGWLLLYLTTGLGVVGFLDDFIKIRKQRNLGLNKRMKFVGQTFIAVSFGDRRPAVPQRQTG